nr:glycosyltransferase family 87 protein [Lolliginicoccus suaedae]
MTTAGIITMVAWPFAVLTVIHRTVILAFNGAVTNDFLPIYTAAQNFLNNRDVYLDNFNWTHPHYLYPPSGTLMISPLGYMDYDIARRTYIIINAVAVLLAAYYLLKLFGFGIRSVAFPVTVLAMFSTESVSNTLIYTNMNGLIFLAEVLFIKFLLERRLWWAGVPMGLTIAIKPILLPLLVFPFLKKQWQPFMGAIGIPIVLLTIAWPLSKDPARFVRETAPYLAESRDYFNSAISGNAAYYGLPEWLILGLRGGMAVIVLISLWLLFRYYRHEELFFLCTAASVILTAQFLIGSLGQMYYSMLMFPLLMTVVMRNSVVRNWPAWLAAYGFLTFDMWYSVPWRQFGEAAQFLRTTFGWTLILIVVFVVLINRWLDARRLGTLHEGLDPPYIRDDVEYSGIPERYRFPEGRPAGKAAAAE